MAKPLPWFVANGKKIVGIGRNFADHAKELVPVYQLPSDSNCAFHFGQQSLATMDI